MTEKNSQTDPIDKKLEGLFLQMREEDARNAPDFPGGSAIAESVESAQPVFNPRAPFGLAGALAASVVLAIVALPASQAPEELYLEVMGANTLVTDELLLATPSLTPELNELSEPYTAPAVDYESLWN